MTEKWLVTGGSGQVGMALRRTPPAGIEIFAPAREAPDLANLPDDLAPLLEGVSAIVNCGGFTAVDRAESEPQLVEAINSIAPAKLPSVAERAVISVTHVSTDDKFPSDGSGPWAKGAAPEPASVYGRTKRAGGQAVRDSGARHAIVRSEGAISADGSNFAEIILRLGEKNKVVRVVADQRGTPIHAGDLASALTTFTQRFIDSRDQASGIWHCADSGETTWYGLTSHIFACYAAQGLKVPLGVEAISTAKYPIPARRPAGSPLNGARIAADFGVEMCPSNETTEEIIKSLAQEKQAA